MKIQFTPEQVMEIGEVWGDVYLHNLPTEEVLSRYKPEEILSRYKPEEILSRYKPEEVLSRYTLSERLAGIKPEELEAYLKNIRGEKIVNGA